MKHPPTFKFATSGGRFRVKLSNCGNPDFRQDPDRKLPGTFNAWAHCDSLLEARRLCRDYMTFFNLGSGNWNGGEVETVEGVQIGRFSPNGRCWKPGPWPTEEIIIDKEEACPA